MQQLHIRLRYLQVGFSYEIVKKMLRQKDTAQVRPCQSGHKKAIIQVIAKMMRV